MKKITLLFCLAYIGGFAQTIAVQQFATGFSSPVEITHAGDSRLFVVQQGGSIKILNPDGTVSDQNFLTLPANTISTGSERGLLGLAFHPDYAENGYFFINYTRFGDGATVVARYKVSDDPNIADVNSGVPVITIIQPFSNHNGGTLKFGPDGYLYIGMGDGGSGGDPGNRAQNIDENLGKMLRLDVNVDNGGPMYTIPATNPYAGAIPGNDEIWAIGLRNPWKFSFDRQTGDLWIADVGQGAIEEINKVASDAAGLNYGWKCYEGSQVFSTCNAPVDYTFPVGEYTHSGTGGCSITGGYVYRGNTYPNFAGKYFFADYCVNKVGMYTEGVGITFSSSLTGVGGITSLGEDVNGELYLASSSNGRIYKIIDTSLGISDFASNGLVLYPNPAKSVVNIKSDSRVLTNAKVFDLSGKLLIDNTMSGSGLYALDISTLSTGMYLLSVSDNNGKSFDTRLSVE